jgi:hypothetical protein
VRQPAAVVACYPALARGGHPDDRAPIDNEERSEFMGGSKILGLVLLVAGAILLYFGFNATESVGEQVVEGVTGNYTDQTMWYLIGGAVAAVAGLGLLVLGKK